MQRSKPKFVVAVPHAKFHKEEEEPVSSNKVEHVASHIHPVGIRQNNHQVSNNGNDDIKHEHADRKSYVFFAKCRTNDADYENYDKCQQGY